jgi:hypothetical protein
MGRESFSMGTSLAWAPKEAKERTADIPKSDGGEAIPWHGVSLDCFTSLATTNRG